MQSKWSEKEAAEFVVRYGAKWGENLVLRTYSARLLGSEEKLVLHGGGNTSVKATHRNLLGEFVPAVFVKASGFNMATIEPEGHPGLDLEYVKRLRALNELPDELMMNELRTHLFDAWAATPSVESLAHAFLPPKFIDHTHADAILALTNQMGGDDLVRAALGADVIILPYVRPGFQLAKAAAAAYEAKPKACGMVWTHHGIMTWGETARESYERMVELVTRAEEFVAKRATRPLAVRVSTSLETAQERLTRVAPIVRGLLAEPSGDPDRPYRRVILQALVSRETVDFVDSDRGKEIALTAPLTSDHLIRTKALPLWIDNPDYSDLGRLREQLSGAIQAYSTAYDAYVERHASRVPSGLARLDSLPRVVLMPGLGAICAGKDVAAARVARDVTAHTLAVKAAIAAMGTYQELAEAELFEMEYHTFQHAKLGSGAEPSLARQVAIVTGAAGAIGTAICEGLLENGCHVAITDLPSPALDSFVEEMMQRYGDRVLGVPLDVTNPDSTVEAFGTIARTWGGVDLIVVNAGIALVSSLAEMRLEAFQKLERVNVEGTLLLLAEAAHHFKTQGTGGDVVLVSTKNVFSPGAKFGAYSATKAASHQLARIASLELAEIGVRVNMVSPDAVFGHGARRSGLWAEVGPDRMRARGLDEAGLEEYYRSRNLLKARITGRHVAKAVLFFATRQTPTTGATIPVDGGLPDATPR